MAGIDRREFLRRSAVAGAALGLMPLAAQAATPHRVTLGKTGLSISDIGFGGSRIGGDEATVRHAFERGINYYDTAEGYGGGSSERTIGRALADVRDRVIIATKGKFGARTGRDEMMSSLEGSLRRLRMDSVDVYFNHAVNDPKVIANPEWPEFLARAKQQGKIRFSGMSGHGGRLVECVDRAIEDDVADVLLLGYNFGQDPSFTQRFTARMDFIAVQPGLPAAMERARAKGVGVIAMKTLRGARLNDMRPHERPGGTFAQAAFRWVLTGPYADSLIVTMRSPEQVDEYLVASGSGVPSNRDEALLQHYEQTVGSTQCRYGCDACLSACPAGVPIPEVLRTRMYAEDYEDVELALEDYARLGAAASPCTSCSHQACASACPFGLAIPELTSRTHARLGRGNGHT